MAKARNKKTQFSESAIKNSRSYLQYYNRLSDMAISSFEWLNLPESVDARFLESILFTDGNAIFFMDEVLGALTLQCTIGGKLNVYRIPIDRRAYAVNGYNKQLTDKDSVIIYNNLIHTNSMLDIEMFATRLYNVDRTIDVNINAQKTPVLITCDENERLTLQNLYMQYDGNQPFIFARKGLLQDNKITVLKTDAPFLAKELTEYKTNVWNEALTYLGITNISINKRARLITDEVVRMQGGTLANRHSRLEARKQACKQINSMFGLNIDVRFRDIDEEDVDENEEGVNDDWQNTQPN